MSAPQALMVTEDEAALLSASLAFWLRELDSVVVDSEQTRSYLHSVRARVIPLRDRIEVELVFPRPTRIEL